MSRSSPSPASLSAGTWFLWMAAMGWGVALRWMIWTDRPLWLDEAIQAELYLAESWLPVSRATDLHPPLLTLLTRMLPPPVSDIALRSVSLAAGLLHVPVATWAALRWYGVQASVSAAVLAASLSPWALYSGEARPYALGILVTTWFLGTLARGSAPHRALAACAVLATQYSAWPVVFASIWRVERHRGVRVLSLFFAAVLGIGLARHQRAAQGLGLSDGFLAPWFWQPGEVLSFTLLRTPELFGYALWGTRSAAAWWLGLLVLAVLFWWLSWSPRDRRPLQIAVVSTAGVWALAGVGLHPFGGVRQLLVLTPAWVLWSAPHLGTRGVLFILAVGLAGVTRHPGLPVQDVPCALARLPEPALLDASVAPTVRWYAPDRRDTALPWRSGRALVAHMPPLPTGELVLIHADHRRSDLRALVAHLKARGWRADEDRRCRGITTTHFHGPPQAP